MNLHVERMKIHMHMDRRVRWVRRWFYDFCDDYAEKIGFTLWGIVAFFVCYGIWVVVR